MENNDDKTKNVGGLGLDTPLMESEGTNPNQINQDLNCLKDKNLESEKPSLYEYTKLNLFSIKEDKYAIDRIKNLTLNISSGELNNYKEYNEVLSILNNAMKYQKRFKNIPIEQNKEYNLVQSLNLLLKEQAKILHKQKRHETLKSELRKSLAPKIRPYANWLLETTFTEDYNNLLRFGVIKPEANLDYQVNSTPQYFNKSKFYTGLIGAGITGLIGAGLMCFDQKYGSAITFGLAGGIATITGFYQERLFSKKHNVEYQKLKGETLEKILDTDEVYNK